VRVKYLVVGGGIMGVSIALHLAKRSNPLSEPVLLLEKSALGAGSSGRSGAILRTMYSERALVGMARDSIREYSTFLQRIGRSVGYRQSGVMTLGGPAQPEWPARLAANVETMQGLGVEVELLDAAGVRGVFPGIEIDDGVVGAWEPQGGYLDPHTTLDSFAALARSYGATTRFGVGARNLLLDGGKVVGVETDAGEITCERVVLAAGAWTRALLARAGVELPFRAVRPCNHFLDMPGSEGEGVQPEQPEPLFAIDDQLEHLEERFERPDGSVPNHPVLIDLERGFYSRCESRLGRTRIGHIDYEHDDEIPDPDELDESVPEELKSWASGVLRERLPIYADQGDAGSQAAIYTLTPDAQAIIGRIDEIEGLYVAAGFSGHGFKLAPAVGIGVAEMMRDEPVSSFEEEFFAPGRLRDTDTSSARVQAFGL